MGDDGLPHGVKGSTVAAGVKPGRDWRPVPPMTAIRTGSWKGELSGGMVGRSVRCSF